MGPIVVWANRPTGFLVGVRGRDVRPRPPHPCGPVADAWVSQRSGSTWNPCDGPHAYRAGPYPSSSRQKHQLSNRVCLVVCSGASIRSAAWSIRVPRAVRETASRTPVGNPYAARIGHVRRRLSHGATCLCGKRPLEPYSKYRILSDTFLAARRPLLLLRSRNHEIGRCVSNCAFSTGRPDSCL